MQGDIVLTSSNIFISMSLQNNLCNGLNKGIFLFFVCLSPTAIHLSTEINLWVPLRIPMTSPVFAELTFQAGVKNSFLIF